MNKLFLFSGTLPKGSLSLRDSFGAGHFRKGYNSYLLKLNHHPNLKIRKSLSHFYYIFHVKSLTRF